MLALNETRTKTKTARTTGLALSLLLLLPVALIAKAAKRPEPGPTQEVSFPEFQEKTLANGLRVVVIEHHEQPSVSLRLVLDAGQIHEPADKPGLAQATAAMLDQGTTKRSLQEIAQAIDFVGGGLGAGAGPDRAFATAFVTSDQLDLGLELLSDMVLRPSFPEAELERWRTRTVSGLQVQFTDPSFLASAAIDRAIYGAHPYGQPGGGTPESLSSLSKEDLVAFHQRTYLPNTAILAVVGDVDPKQAFAKAENAFGGWAKGEAPTLPAATEPASGPRKIVVIDKPDAVQTEIRIGQPGLAHADTDKFVSEVYNSVVGGGVSARLYTEIRQKRGLSYGAGSAFSTLRQPGKFQARTFTKTESTVETVQLALEVLDGLRSTAVPTNELEDRKTYITGAFPMQVETPDGIANQVLQALFHGKDKSYLDSYNSRITQVGSGDVQSFAKRRMDPGAMVIVLAGNAEAFLPELEAAKLGEIERIPLGELDLMYPALRRPKTAESAVSAEDKAKAMELLAKVVAAYGGSAFTDQKTQIVRGTGTFSPPGAPQPMPISRLRETQELPLKRRLEISLPMGELIQGFDGKVGWISMMGQVQDQSAAMQERKHYGLTLLRKLDNGSWEGRPLPTEDWQGKEASVVELRDGEGHRTAFGVDPTSHLLFATRFNLQGTEVEERYGDHRKVDGVQVPHQVEVRQNGSTMIEINLDEVEINPDLEGSLFAKPDA